MKLKEIDRVDLFKKISIEFPNGRGVEVGTFKGEFSKCITENWDGTLYMVDVWRPLGDEYSDMLNHENHQSAYSDCINNIRGREDNCIMIRSTSKKAVELFADESLDFVYIDANHSYDYVVEDINLWYPKLKKGGYFLGHDYIDIDWYNDPYFMENGKDKAIYGSDGKYMGVFGVNPAVDEFCERNNYDKIITNEWFGTWMLKKKINLHVLVCYDKAYTSIADVTIPNNIQKYCDLHGYGLHIDYSDSFDNGRPAQWRKVEASMEILEKNPEIDWLFFIDADCLFMNSDVKLESFLNTTASFIVPSHSQKCDNDHEIVGVEGVKNVITSQFFVKNNNIGMSILKDLWAGENNDRLNDFDHEGRGVRILLNSGRYKNDIRVVEERLLNTFWYNNNPFMVYHFSSFTQNIYQTNDFIVHVTGYSLPEKTEILRRLIHFSKLINNGENL